MSEPDGSDIAVTPSDSKSVSFNPEDIACFGTIEKGHPECDTCMFNIECEKKAIDMVK